MFKNYLLEEKSEFIDKVISKNGPTCLVYEGSRINVYYHLSGKEPRGLISIGEISKIDNNFSKSKANSLKNTSKKFEKLFEQLFVNLGKVAKSPDKKIDTIFVDYPLKHESGKTVRVYVEYFKDRDEHIIFFNNSVIGENFLIHWLLHEYAHIYLDSMKKGMHNKIKKFIEENLVGKDPEQLIKDKWIVRNYSLKSYEEFFSDTIMALAWDAYSLNDDIARFMAEIL